MAWDRATLRQLLAERTSLSELQTMAFDLGVEFEGMSKNDLILGLIGFHEQRQAEDKLLGWLAKNRRDIDLTPIRQSAPAARPASPPPAPPAPSDRKLRVFLNHASVDKPKVRDLYHLLLDDGFQPWLDEEELLPGQNWDLEIRKALRASDAILVCLSQKSVTKAGVVQKEIKLGLDIADEQPDGAIFIIPVRLEECDVPDRLSGYQWVNLYDKGGYSRLARALQARATALGL